MTLVELAAQVPTRFGCRVEVPPGFDLSAVRVVDATHDSREARPGWLFAAVVGEHVDGHDHVGEAASAGAVAALVERPVAVDIPQLVVNSTRAAVGHVAAAVHGHPARALTTVGVTGTNGKTTTSQLLSGALAPLGAIEVFGTLSGARTTPEATDLQRGLRLARDRGASCVVMEVSSHALALHRVAGAWFDVAVFTNLGRDHLDLHGTQEDYFLAKASLFADDMTGTAVINVDDAHGRRLAGDVVVPVVPYSRRDASDVEVAADHLALSWRGHRVRAPIGGEVNVSNVIATLTVGEVLGVDPEEMIAGLAAADRVPGRFEVVSGPADAVTVVVDYAHTPDGLDALLTSVRRVAGAGEVHVVFGCGGDRDRDKRPGMGAAAARGADVVVVTSDNPRHEDPAAIIDAVLTGIEPVARARVITEVDRERAIVEAIDRAGPGDVVVVAGKGHESTQTIGDSVRPFDDRQVARAALEVRR